MNVTKNAICAIALAAGASLMATTAKANTVIDSFNVPAAGTVLSTNGNATQTTGGLAVSDVIGGVRKVSIDATSGAGDDPILSVRVNRNGAKGAVTLNSDDGISGNFTFDYGTAGDLAANMTGSNQFWIKFLKADAGATMKMTLTDLDSTSTVTLLEPSGPHTTVIPFSSFSGIDFSHVKAVELKILGGDSYDARIDSITAVPAPAAVWAGVSLLGGLAARRFRRR